MRDRNKRCSSMMFMRVFLSVVLLLMVWGCGGSGSAPPGATITINPSSISVPDLRTQPLWYTRSFQIIVKDSSGNPLGDKDLSISFKPNAAGVLRFNVGNNPTTDHNGVYIFHFDYLLGVGAYVADLDVTSGTAHGSAKFTVIQEIELIVVPSKQTVNGAQGGNATFTIFGGTPPYIIAPDNISFPPVPATVNESGGNFKVNVKANTQATGVNYTITDHVGNTVTATLTIIFDTTDFFLFPVSATIPVDGSVTFSIVGGTPSIVGGIPRFDISADRPADVEIFYDASVDPRSFTVVGINRADKVTITVMDKDHRTTTATVTIE